MVVHHSFQQTRKQNKSNELFIHSQIQIQIQIVRLLLLPIMAAAAAAATTILVFSPFASPFLLALSAMTLISIMVLAVGEFVGKHLQYSKFWSPRNESKRLRLSLSLSLHSRSAMLLCYCPAFSVSVMAFFLIPHHFLHSRIFLIKSFLLFHFFKRIFEVLFIHKYGNKMAVKGVILILISYVMFTISTIYAQLVSEDLAEPLINLKWPGLLFFCIGISGNFYHHFLLSKLRKEGDKDYKIPRGGFFELVVCPHYLFEIIEFFGIAFVSQTLFAFVFALSSALFLIARSYGTRNWYVSKFEDFPPHVKAIVPFVF